MWRKTLGLPSVTNGKGPHRLEQEWDDKWIAEKDTILGESTANTGARPDIEGLQVEVDPGVGKYTGGLYESGGRGWVIMPTPKGERALKPGQ